MYIVAKATDIVSNFGTVIDFTVRRPRMVVGFITTYAISAYYPQRCEFDSRSGEVYWIHHYVMSLSVTCDRSLIFSGYSGFLHQWKWPPRYNWNIVESGVKHLNTNLFVVHIALTIYFVFNIVYAFYLTTCLFVYVMYMVILLN